MVSGANLSNLSNLSFEILENKLDKAEEVENQPAILINVAIEATDGYCELDGLGGSSNAVEVTILEANSSSNRSQSEELDGFCCVVAGDASNLVQGASVNCVESKQEQGFENPS